jgi:hypothetical protein
MCPELCPSPFKERCKLPMGGSVEAEEPWQKRNCEKDQCMCCACSVSQDYIQGVTWHQNPDEQYYVPSRRATEKYTRTET